MRARELSRSPRRDRTACPSLENHLPHPSAGLPKSCSFASRRSRRLGHRNTGLQEHLPPLVRWCENPFSHRCCDPYRACEKGFSHEFEIPERINTRIQHPVRVHAKCCEARGSVHLVFDALAIDTPACKNIFHRARAVHPPMKSSFICGAERNSHPWRVTRTISSSPTYP